MPAVVTEPSVYLRAVQMWISRFPLHPVAMEDGISEVMGWCFAVLVRCLNVSAHQATIEPDHTRDLVVKSCVMLMARSCKHAMAENHESGIIPSFALDNLRPEGSPLSRIWEPTCGSRSYFQKPEAFWSKGSWPTPTGNAWRSEPPSAVGV